MVRQAEIPAISAGELPGMEAPRLGEPYLLTPGPLTTAYGVKEKMLRDWGSWDGDFRAMTAALREGILALAGDSRGEFDCVPMQGSGTFSVEAMLGSPTPMARTALLASLAAPEPTDQGPGHPRR